MTSAGNRSSSRSNGTAATYQSADERFAVAHLHADDAIAV